MALIMKVAGREYPVPDFETLTFKEGRMIKNVVGLTMGQLPKAFEDGDVDAILAFFVVAKQRMDGDFNLDQLENLAISDLELVDSADVSEEESEDLDQEAPVKEEKTESKQKQSSTKQ